MVGLRDITDAVALLFEGLAYQRTGETTAVVAGEIRVTNMSADTLGSPLRFQVLRLACGFAGRGSAAARLEVSSAMVTYPVDVWFADSLTFTAERDFGGRRLVQVTLDPAGRFPDRDSAENVWPRQLAPRERPNIEDPGARLFRTKTRPPD